MILYGCIVDYYYYFVPPLSNLILDYDRMLGREQIRSSDVTKHDDEGAELTSTSNERDLLRCRLAKLGIHPSVDESIAAKLHVRGCAEWQPHESRGRGVRDRRVNGIERDAGRITTLRGCMCERERKK